MRDPKQAILKHSEIIDKKFSVVFFIKKGSHAETYRVKDQQGNTRFLKLFDLAKLHRTQFDSEGNIKEIEFLKNINHPNIVRYMADGEWIKNNRRYAYLILDFISGETLAERLKRDYTISAYEIQQIIGGVLNGLKYLHNRENPVVHNDINHHNIMLDLSGNALVPKIIDFGYARYFLNSTKVYYREGLNPYYLAPECFNNAFSPQSDLFSIGALIYHLLTGMPPWFIDLSDYMKDRIEMEDAIIEARNKSLKKPAFAVPKVENTDRENLFVIAEKALQTDIESRFHSANEIIKALNGEFEVEIQNKNTSNKYVKTSMNKPAKKRQGFNDIAGMDELKETLYHDVIRALEEKELYEKYGLTIPNGILLYGPPGCGKSFFAEKLAEEVSYNYVEIKPSTLASIYVHGSQEKIGKLFADAKKNAPTILNFTEFDAFVPNRESRAGQTQSGEVNEFLAQLENCGEQGVFVIASTNRPNLIDPAVLRAGRIDKIFFIPPPDYKARKEMFRILLQKRPLDFGIDYDLLAERTKNFVSADVKNIINEASRTAIRNNSKITQQMLEKVIDKTRPSVNEDEINKYRSIKEKLEGINKHKNRTQIGFKINRKK